MLGASNRCNCGRRTGRVSEVMPANADASAEEDGSDGTQGARSQPYAYTADGLEFRSKAVTPKKFEPADNARGAEDS